MNKRQYTKMKWTGLAMLLVLVLAIAGCGAQQNNAATPAAANDTPVEDAGTKQATSDTASDSDTRTIEYLGETYTLPKNVTKIVVTGAMEAMEDAAALDVQLAGAISVGGQFPEVFAEITREAESIGEKQQPDFEKIVQISPDVILGTTKFQPEVLEKLQKIATTIPVSHISTNWEANLRLMGELAGKQEEAERILTQYKSDAQAANTSLKAKLQGNTVAAIRIRGAQAYVYPADIYLNPVLYGEIGLEVPPQISAAKTQEAISDEQLAEMNPDYLFIEFAASENNEAEKAYEELKKKPIIQNIKAFKQDQVFVNELDPLLEGGTAFSRIQFLEIVQNLLAKQ